MNRSLFFKIAMFLAILTGLCSAASFNSFGLKVYTMESAHFTIHYQEGLKSTACEIGDILEKLYTNYRNTYGLAIPRKTDVLVSSSKSGNGFSYSPANMISIDANGDFFVLRGSRNWLDDVVRHEYAHFLSLWISEKFPHIIPYIQLGYFDHPNDPKRAELLAIIPPDGLPHWFSEGIAQYESFRNGGDKWDSHRDMYMRTFTLSNTLSSWDHMAVFAGKGEDFEKTYNHGFSMVRYIVETYGYDKLVAMCRESSKIYRFNFNGVVRSVLGISANQLYVDWKQSLEIYYKKQVASLGKQVFGKKLVTDGYYNYWPRFSPDEQKIYFTSNGKNDYYYSSLVSYNRSDTIKDTTKRVKPEIGVINDFYSIHSASGAIAYCNDKSPKSTLPPRLGGYQTSDVFIDTLPPAKKPFNLFARKKERQITRKLNLVAATFSPSGDRLVCVQQQKDRFLLYVVDTSGKKLSLLYPDSNDTKKTIKFIHSVDWSADGRHIAISFIDHNNRRIGIFDTASHTFTAISDTVHDSRDPRFSADGKALYFAWDRSGIFNIYRYTFGDSTLDQITNVTGSAFTPEISRDQKTLLYAGYDKSGFGIYCIDSVTALKSERFDTLFVDRNPVTPRHITTAFSRSEPYNRLPRTCLVVPMIYDNQILPQSNDVFKGEDILKAGAMFTLFDPWSWVGSGSTLNAYMLFEPGKILRFFDFDNGFISPEQNYEMGIFATTSLLPITLSADYFQIGVAGSDQFFEEREGKLMDLKYSQRVHYSDLIATHEFNKALKLHALASYNVYNIFLNTKPLYGANFSYDAATGWRTGAMLTCFANARNERMLISPQGLYLKAQYDFFHQELLNFDKSFTFDETSKKFVDEVFDKYQYHQLALRLKTGFPTPWYDKHDIHLTGDFSGVHLTNASQKRLERSANGQGIPSFHQPKGLLPGYTYYYRDTLHKASGVDSTVVDTFPLSGNYLAMLGASYRLPIWKPLIDKKILFAYLHSIYGVINFNAGSAWQNFERISEFNRNDWLLSVGAELRMEATSFYSFPLCVSLRWDRGLDKPAPIGGNRFQLMVGLGFDGWEMIDQPDYFKPNALGRN